MSRKAAIQNNERQCSRCQLSKPLTEFYGRPDAEGGRKRSHCKDCHRSYRLAHAERQKKYHVAWYAKNKDKVKAQTKAYADAHLEQTRAYKRKYSDTHPDQKNIENSRRRARVKQSPVNDFTAAQWEEIKARYKYCCAYCRKKSKRLTQDHITPLAKGGAHTAINIIPACKSCNSRKRDKHVLSPVQPVLLTFC